MGYIIVLIVIIVCWFFIIPFFLKRYGIKRISNKVTATTRKLRNFVENKSVYGVETYSAWLKPAPEEIWARIIAHAVNNKKLFADLGTKIYVACATIDKLIEHDQCVSICINAGHIKSNSLHTNNEEDNDDGIDLQEMAQRRQNLVAIIEQSFSDINHQIKYNTKDEKGTISP